MRSVDKIVGFRHDAGREGYIVKRNRHRHDIYNSEKKLLIGTLQDGELKFNPKNSANGERIKLIDIAQKYKFVISYSTE